jgi:hypothetical protein
LFFDALDGYEESLKKLLLSIDYSQVPYKFSPYRIHINQVVQEVIQEKNLEKFEEYVADFYYLSKEDALKLDDPSIPLNLTCRKLEKKHAKFVDDVWSGKYRDSLYFMERLLANNPALGLFNKENDNPVAWIVKREYGTIGNLHVLDEYRGKGLAAIISIMFSKEVAKMGYDSVVSIFLDNLPSKKIFEKLNFQKIDQNCRLQVCAKPLRIQL